MLKHKLFKTETTKISFVSSDDGTRQLRLMSSLHSRCECNANLCKRGLLCSWTKAGMGVRLPATALSVLRTVLPVGAFPPINSTSQYVLLFGPKPGRSTPMLFSLRPGRSTPKVKSPKLGWSVETGHNSPMEQPVASTPSTYASIALATWKHVRTPVDRTGSPHV